MSTHNHGNCSACNFQDAEIARLRAEIEALRVRVEQRDNDCSMYAEAIGVATCAKPSMQVRAGDPIGMMEEVVQECDALRAKVERLGRRS